MKEKMKFFICLAVSCLWRVKEMSCEGMGENSKSDDERDEMAGKLKGDEMSRDRMGENSKSDDERDEMAGKLKGDEMDEIKIESDQSSPPEGKAISLKEYSGKRAISKIAKKRGVKYASVTESQSSDYATAKTPDENAPATPFTTKSIPNRCSACDVAFQFDYHYISHCADIHWNYTPYGCTRCPKRFVTKYTLMKHVYKIHDRDRVPKTVLQPVKCDICGIDVRGWTAFEKHALRAHKGVKMMNCPRCPSKFYRRSYLLVHKRKKHPDSDAILICKHCKNFQNTDTLKDHEEYCEARRMNNRIQPKKTEKPSDDVKYACGECRGEFDSMERLEEHYSQQHPEAGMHCCEYCGATFRAKSFLEEHFSDARHPRGEKLSKTTLKRRKGKHFVCEYCGGEFVGITEFEKHGLETHPGQPVFRCRECDKGYALEGSLKTHLKEHHNDGKTRCVNCSKCYYNAWHLRRHEANCIKATENIQRLRKEGKPRHYCDICNKEYYMKNVSFKSHLNRHKEYERCKFCEESFHKNKNPNGLANHLKMRHPLNDNIDALLRTIREVETYVKTENAY